MHFLYSFRQVYSIQAHLIPYVHPNIIIIAFWIRGKRTPIPPAISMHDAGITPSAMKFFIRYLGVSIRNRNDAYESHENIRVKVDNSQKSI